MSDQGYQIRITGGPCAGQVFPLSDGEWDIGRNRPCSVRIRDKGVSGAHARLTVDIANRHIQIQDLNSTNGTFVNSVDVGGKTVELSRGDIVRIGNTVFVVDHISTETAEKIDVADENEKAANLTIATDSDDVVLAAGAPEMSDSSTVFDADDIRLQGLRLKDSDYDTLRRTHDRIAQLQEASATFNATMPLRELYTRILDILIQTLHADRGAILIKYNEKNAPVEVVASRVRKEGTSRTDEFVLSETILSQVLEKGVAILSSDAMSDSRFEGAESIAMESIRGAICAPLKLEDKVFGAIYLDTMALKTPFGEEELQFLTIVCNSASVAIDNAFAYRQIEELNANLERRVDERTADLKEALQELKAVQSQLIHSEKMSSLGQLVAGIAHEINNPMNFVYNGIGPLRDHIGAMEEALKVFDEMTTVESAEREKVEDCKSKLKLKSRIRAVSELIETIEEGAARTVDIVKELREFSRLDEAELKQADIHDGLDQSIRLLAHGIKNRVEIVKNYGDIPEIYCLPAQLNQVFLNLMGNAEQAIEGRGTITVTTSREGDNVVVSIADTGCGIPDDVLSHIFDPFYTTKDVGKGTGLGLSISYGIVMRHGGEINVKSKVGEGSEFRIVLPIENRDIQ